MEEVYLPTSPTSTSSYSEEAAEVHGSQPYRENTTDPSYYNTGTAQGRWFPDPVPHGNPRGYPPQRHPHQQTRRPPIYSGHGRPSNGSVYSSVGMGSSSTSSEEAGMLPSKSKSRRRCCCRYTWVVIVVVIIGFVVGAFLGMYFLSPPSINSTGKEFCMPCGELMLSSAPEDDYSKTFDRKNKITEDDETREVCCMQDGNLAQLEAYIKAKAEEQIRQDDINGVPLVSKMAQSWQKSGNQTGPPKAMATLFATDTQVVNESVKGKLQTISYTFAANRAFKFEGIQWDQGRGRFIILFPGIYDVSSHVSFVRDASSTESVLFVHKVLRENRGYKQATRQPTTLSQEIQEKECRVASRSDVSCHTSTLLAAYDLKAKDEIFVQVSRPDLLQTGATSFIRIRKVG